MTMTDPIRPKNVTAKITTTDQVVVEFDTEDIPPFILSQHAANQVGSLLSSQASIIRNDSNGENK